MPKSERYNFDLYALKYNCLRQVILGCIFQYFTSNIFVEHRMNCDMLQQMTGPDPVKHPAMQQLPKLSLLQQLNKRLLLTHPLQKLHQRIT